MDATQAAALQVGQRIQWSDHHIDEVIANDTAGQVVKVKRGPGYVEMKTPPPLPPRKPQPVEQNFSYAALLDANLVFANTSLTEDAPADGRFYARDGKNGKWMDVSGGVAPPTIDAGRGLTMTGSTIDLDPAQPLPGEIGGLNEAPSDGTPYVRQDAAWEPAVAGAAIDYRIGLDDTVPGIVDLQPATPAPGEIGGINEPTPDDVVVYARKYDLAGNATWEPISVTGITIADDPPMTPAPVHGQLWYESDTGDTFIWYDDGSSAQWVQIAPGTGGGRDIPILYGIGLTRTGLTVDLDPATNLLLGGLTEPLQDGLSYARQYNQTTQIWEWVETVTGGLQINTVIPDEVKIGAGEPDVLVHCYGKEITPTCVLYWSDGINPAVPIPTSAYVSAVEMTFLATPSQITQEILYTITVQDPAAVAPDPVLGAGAVPFQYVESLKVAGETIDDLGIVYIPPDQGLQVAPDGQLAAVVASESKYGVILDPPFGQATWVRHGEGRWVPAPLPTQIAGNTELEAGIVYIPDDRGLNLGADGSVTLRPAGEYPNLGGIFEPPVLPHGQTYVRSYGQWVEAGPGGLPIDAALYVRVAGDIMQGSLLLAHEGVVAMEAVTVSQLERQKVEAGIGLSQIGPRIDLQPATNIQIGGILDAPDDGAQYVRIFRDWERLPPGSAPLTFRYGLQQTGDIVDIVPPVKSDPAAGIAPELGGVYGTERSDRNGIEIDSNGHISAPLATDLLAGSIIEPPADAKGYVRTTQLDGTSQWVPPAPSDDQGLVPVGRSPTNGLENGYDDFLKANTIWVPLATELLAGSIVEPPADGLQYARSNDIMTGAQWVPSATAGVFVGDSPPPTPEPNQLWFESDTGNLFLYYVDADSSQWIQVNIASTPITGVEEAPTDGQPYVRQSAAWVADTGGGGIVDAPEDGQLYARKDKVWEVVPPDTVGLVDAPNNTNLYARRGGVWSIVPAAGISQSAADARYLKLTGGTITGSLIVSGGATSRFELRSNASNYAVIIHTDVAAGNKSFWVDAYGHYDKVFSYYNDAGAEVRYMKVIRPSGMVNFYTAVDFAITPTFKGVPIVTLAEHQSALDRIDELERRLVTLERRLS